MSDKQPHSQQSPDISSQSNLHGESTAPKSSRAKRIGAAVVAAGLLIVGAANLASDGTNEVSRHKDRTVQADGSPTTVPETTEATIQSTSTSEAEVASETTVPEATSTTSEAGLKQLQELPGYGEKVSESLKERVRKASVVLYSQTKGMEGVSVAFCNGTILDVDGQILISTAAHCVDDNWGVIDSVRATQPSGTTVEVASELPYVYSAYAMDGTFLADIDAIALTATEEHSELSLMRPAIVTSELQDRALPLKFGEPTPGQEAYGYLAPRDVNFQPKEGSFTYIGSGHQYMRYENLYNAVSAQDALPSCGPGASGGGMVGVNGQFLGVVRASLRGDMNDPRKSVEDQAMWREEVEVQANTAVGDSDICQISVIHPDVVAAQLKVLKK